MDFIEFDAFHTWTKTGLKHCEIPQFDRLLFVITMARSGISDMFQIFFNHHLCLVICQNMCPFHDFFFYQLKTKMCVVCTVN